MSVYYPQTAVRLLVVWETYDITQVTTRAERERLDEQSIRNPATIDIIAKSVNVDINDYTQADTFSLIIDYDQFPFDPRAMRSVQVTIAMENIPSGERIQLRKYNPRTEVDGNLVFIGFADIQEIAFDDASREVFLEGRDYMGLLLDTSRVLIDKKNAAGLVVGSKIAQKPKFTGKLITTAFTSLLREQRAFNGLNVEARLGSDPIPKINGDANNVAGTSYWHIIEKYVAREGLIAYMDLDKLVITNPRNLFAGSEQRLVQMVYGINLSRLSFNRYIGRQKTFNIRVKSRLPNGRRTKNNKTTIQAEMPKDAVTDRFKNLFGVKDASGKFVPKAFVEKQTDIRGTTEDAKPQYQYPFASALVYCTYYLLL